MTSKGPFQLKAFYDSTLSFLSSSCTAAAQLGPVKPLKIVSRNRETHCLASPEKIMRQLGVKSLVSTFR